MQILCPPLFPFPELFNSIELFPPLLPLVVFKSIVLFIGGITIGSVMMGSVVIGGVTIGLVIIGLVTMGSVIIGLVIIGLVTIGSVIITPPLPPFPLPLKVTFCVPFTTVPGITVVVVVVVVVEPGTVVVDVVVEFANVPFPGKYT